jgi:hypothetical protein
MRKSKPPAPIQSYPHIQVSFTPSDVTVKGSGFLANLPGVGANAVHLRVVDANNPTNSIILPYASDRSGDFGTDLPLSSDSFAGLIVVAFSAYDNRLDSKSVPANGPLTSNTVRVTKILSPDPIVTNVPAS